MKTEERFQLLYGPYEPPEIPADGVLFCEMRGYLRVGRWSNALIPWPKRWRANSLILCGDLARAVRQESVDAISYHWGVCRLVVHKWRQALDVSENTPGTSQYRKWALADGAARRQERDISRALERNAHVRAPRPQHERGHPLISPAASRAARRRIARTGAFDPELKVWSPDEDKLLGTAPDKEIATLLGRSLMAVTARRIVLGIRAPNHVYSRPWTAEEEKLLGTMPDAELAARLGRTEQAIYERRISRFPETRQRAAPKLRAGSRFGKWAPGELALLGTARDEEVAKAVSRSAEAVRAMRKKLGVPNVSDLRPPRWPSAQDELLGRMPDKELVRLTGRSVTAIRARRWLKRIPAYQATSRDWSESELAILGTRPDPEVARRLSRSLASVLHKRVRMQVPPFKAQARAWTTAEDRLLGTTSDSQVAARLGLTRGAVQDRRVHLKIAPYCPAHRKWSAAEDQLLGTASDAEIAERISRSEMSVRLRRQAKGIFRPHPVYQRLYTATENRMLGKMTDKAFATRFHRNIAAVRAHRQALGIRALRIKNLPWKPADDALLGTRPDREVALLLGRTVESVKVRRCHFGIAPRNRR